MTHFWPDYTALIAELRAEAAASEELHPDDSCIYTMRRAADALEAERKVRAEEYAIATHLRSTERAAREEAERLLDMSGQELYCLKNDVEQAEAKLAEALAAKERAEAERDEMLKRYYWPHVAVAAAEAEVVLLTAERDALTAALAAMTEERNEWAANAGTVFPPGHGLTEDRHTHSTAEPAKAEEP